VPEDMSSDDRQDLQQHLAVVQQLLALDAVRKHDTRFDNEVAVLVPADDLEAATAIVQALFGTPVKAADEKPARELAKSSMVDAMGGARGGQTLYAKVLGPTLCVYVALWPWGSGKKITLKIGVHDNPPSCLQ
jgi:hypothetical protein